MRFTRQQRGVTVPVDMVYLDATANPTRLSDVTLTADCAGLLYTPPREVTGTFDGTPFPLASEDFLTPVTGELVLTYVGGLASGLHTRSFRIQTGLWQGVGSLMMSGAGFGVGGQGDALTLPLCYLTVRPTVTTPTPLVIVPDSAWR